ARFLKDEEDTEKEIKRLRGTTIPPSEELNKLLESLEAAPLNSGVREAELLKRPEITYKMLEPFDKSRPPLPFKITDRVQTEIKYEGYILKQSAHAKEQQRLRDVKLTDEDFNDISGLRLEAREKLLKIRPESIGAAMNISGVSPADISVLMLHIEKKRRLEE
ncbi:MAG: tRNA uridine-5-carboxymethylaminomethyl(34) synthesis enzyme MnmG, partial [Oscillospiraceae bacterium]